MSKKSLIVLSICLVLGAGIALLALAGSLNEDGDVDPDHGIKNLTEFTYTITYTLDPEEDPPDVLVIGYLGGFEKWEEMMSYAVIGEIYVHYWYTTTLPEAGEWSFKFDVVGGEVTNMHLGPTVYNS